jgi:hypothetical protein
MGRSKYRWSRTVDRINAVYSGMQAIIMLDACRLAHFRCCYGVVTAVWMSPFDDAILEPKIEICRLTNFILLHLSFANLPQRFSERGKFNSKQNGTQSDAYFVKFFFDVASRWTG